MKLEELLRHVADNVENGWLATSGVHYLGRPIPVEADHYIESFDWDHPDKYTLAPRMVRINGIEVKAGLSEAPSPDTEYYLINIGGHEKLVDNFIWGGDDFDFTALKRGLAFPHTEQGREDAIAMAKAMLIREEV